MRRQIPVVLGSALCAWGLSAVPAQAAVDTHEENGVIFEFDTASPVAGATVIGFNETLLPDDVTIPSSIASAAVNYTVVAIGPDAFKDAEIDSADIPNSVTLIDHGAFNRSTLTTVDLSNNLSEIGYTAFYASGLESIEIPPSVTSIGDGAFAAINDLGAVTIPDSVVSVGDTAFGFSGITSVVVGSGVETIGWRTFYDNDLSSVTLREGVQDIGLEAFARNELTSIDLPESLEEIGDQAFEENRLQSVTIPAGVASIGSSAFLQQDQIEPEGGALAEAVFEGKVPSVISDGAADFPSFDTYRPGFVVRYPPRFDVSQVGPGGFNSPEWMAYVAEPSTVKPSLKIKRPGKVKERKKFTVRVRVRDGGHHVEGGDVKIVFKGLPGKPPKIRTVEDGWVEVKYKAPSVSSTKSFNIHAKYLPRSGPYVKTKTVRSIKVTNS